MPEFLLLDAVEGSIEHVAFDALAATLREALRQNGPVIGVCGHAGFRVPHVAPLLRLFADLANAVGATIRLESALADARHSSDDRGSSPLRVHVDVTDPRAGTVTRKERLRLDLTGDPYVSQIPFAPPQRLARTTLSQRTILDAYRRVLSGPAYRWVSSHVVAAAERTAAIAGGTLLDFHRHLRDAVLAEQLDGVASIRLTATRATAFPADFHSHIMATHQGQAAVSVDLVKDLDHAREIVSFFRAARQRFPDSRLPRWMFGQLGTLAYFCQGMRAGAPDVATAIAGTQP